MNYLAIFQSELTSANQAVLRGSRAKESISWHDLQPGSSTACLVVGGKRGQAQILSLSENELVLELNLDKPALVLPNTEIIVSVPRPQTVKKVLNIAGMLGIRRVHFTRTRNTVKSYLQSKTLLAENINAELLKGVEQSGNSWLPEVYVHPLFKPFIKDVLPEELKNRAGEQLLLLADTCAEKLNPSTLTVTDPANLVATLAIGPESGWDKGEVEDFRSLGFSRIGLGQPILRVDTALTYLLGQIELLRSIQTRS